MRVSFFALGVVAIVLLLAGCIGPPSSNAGFVEVVLEDDSCPANVCSTEYLIHSDGWLVIRTLASSLEPDSIHFEVYKIPSQLASFLVSDASDEFSGSVDNVCSNCRLFNLFVFDGKKLVRQNVPVDSLDGEKIKPFFDRIRLLDKTGFVSEDFFVQLVVQKEPNRFVDYHFFKDGSFIRSEFGYGNGEILGATVGRLPEKVQPIVNAVSNDYFSSPIDQSCPDTVWFGSLMVFDGNRSEYRDFCTGNKGADALFVELVSKWS